MMRTILIACLLSSTPLLAEEADKGEIRRLRLENAKLKKKLAESEDFGRQCTAAVLQVNEFLKWQQATLSQPTGRTSPPLPHP